MNTQDTASTIEKVGEEQARLVKEAVKRQVRNETIDELCDWLHSCIESVEHGTEVYKACTAMVNAMRAKKT